MIALRILSILYPILIFTAITYFGIKVATACVMGSGVLLFLLTKIAPAFKQSSGGTLNLMRYDLLAVVMIGLGLCAWIFSAERILLVYPVVINIILFVIFSGSLSTEKTIVERIARLRTPNLPERAVAYTRNVTKCWCLFFAVNGSIAFVTAYYFPLDVWMLYNGFIAYILMGILFGVEFLVRLSVMRDNNDAG